MAPLRTTAGSRTPRLSTVAFGRTGLAVSRIALGTVALGMEYGIPTGYGLRPSIREADGVLHTALDLGVNLVDTAPSYGESESIIGRVLRRRREEFFIATKVAPCPGARPSVDSSVTASLAALQTDFLDVVQIHCSPTDTEPDPDTCEALCELRSRGLLRYLGVSAYTSACALSAIESGLFDCLQLPYNALDRRMEAVVLPAARSAQVGVLARSVLLKGALTDRYQYLPDGLSPLKECVESLRECLRYEVETLPELAYRYALSEAAIDSVLAGTTTVHELESAVRWAEKGPLPAKLIASIKSLAVPDNVMLTPAFWPSLV